MSSTYSPLYNPKSLWDVLNTQCLDVYFADKKKTKTKQKDKNYFTIKLLENIAPVF